MGDVKRYNLEDYLGLQFVHEQHDGKFVLYADHRAVLESIINDEAVLGDHNIIPSYKVEIAFLLTRHNALVEAVAWERECETVRNELRMFRNWPETGEAQRSYFAARAEVDRLIANVRTVARGRDDIQREL